MTGSIEQNGDDDNFEEIVLQIIGLTKQPIEDVSDIIRRKIECLTRIIIKEDGIFNDQNFFKIRPAQLLEPKSRLEQAARAFGGDHTEIIGMLNNAHELAERLSREKNPKRWAAWDRMMEESIAENRDYEEETNRDLEALTANVFPSIDVPSFQVIPAENARELLQKIYFLFFREDPENTFTDERFLTVQVLELLDYTLKYLSEIHAISSAQLQQAREFISQLLSSNAQRFK